MEGDVYVLQHSHGDDDGHGHDQQKGVGDNYLGVGDISKSYGEKINQGVVSPDVLLEESLVVMDQANTGMLKAQKQLIKAAMLCMMFMICEVIAGILSNSLAILTDSAHMLSDLCSFLLSLFAIWLSSLHGTDSMSFGYHRAEILGALMSVMIIWAMTGFLVTTAIKRLFYPEQVNGLFMIVTGFIGFGTNLIITKILDTHDHHSHGHHHGHHHGHVHDDGHDDGSNDKVGNQKVGIRSICSSRTKISYSKHDDHHNEDLGDHDDHHHHHHDHENKDNKKDEKSSSSSSSSSSSDNQQQQQQQQQHTIPITSGSLTTTMRRGISGDNTSRLAISTHTYSSTIKMLEEYKRDVADSVETPYQDHVPSDDTRSNNINMNMNNHGHASLVDGITQAHDDDDHDDDDNVKRKNSLEVFEEIMHSKKEPSLKLIDYHHYHDHHHDDHHGGGGNINVEAAYIHALGDLLQNVGVIIAGLIIYFYPTAYWADPLCTLVFAILVIGTTLSVFFSTMNVLMEGAPSGFSTVLMKSDLQKIKHVVEVHDVHIWSLSVGRPALACHLVVDEEKSANKVLNWATSIVQLKYNILHTTIQIDYSQNKSSCVTESHQKCHD